MKQPEPIRITLRSSYPDSGLKITVLCTARIIELSGMSRCPRVIYSPGPISIRVKSPFLAVANSNAFSKVKTASSHEVPTLVSLPFF